MSASVESDEKLLGVVSLEKHKYPTPAFSIVPAAPAKKSILASAIDKVTAAKSNGHRRFSRSISLFGKSFEPVNEELTQKPTQFKASPTEPALQMSTTRITTSQHSPHLIRKPHQKRESVASITQRQLMKPLPAPLPRSRTINFSLPNTSRYGEPLSPESTRLSLTHSTLYGQQLSPPRRQGAAQGSSPKRGHSMLSIDPNEARNAGAQTQYARTRTPFATKPWPIASPYSTQPHENQVENIGNGAEHLSVTQQEKRLKMRYDSSASVQQYERDTPWENPKVPKGIRTAGLRTMRSRIPTPERREWTHYSSRRSDFAQTGRRQTMNEIPIHERSTDGNDDSLLRRPFGAARAPSNGRKSRIPTPVRHASRSQSFVVSRDDSLLSQDNFSLHTEIARPYGAHSNHPPPQTPDQSGAFCRSNESSPFPSTIKASKTAHGNLETPTPSAHKYSFSESQRARTGVASNLQEEIADDETNESELIPDKRIYITQPVNWWLGRFMAISDRLLTEEMVARSKISAVASADKLVPGAKSPKESMKPPNSDMLDETTRHSFVLKTLWQLCVTSEAREGYRQFREAWLRRERADRAREQRAAESKKAAAKHHRKLGSLQFKGLSAGETVEVKEKVNVFEKLGMKRRSKGG